ncbi:MAG: transcription termination factor NusA [Candidatus Paceibacterota bacterium]
MDLKSLSSAIKQIADNRGISTEKVKEAIEGALASAYKREYRDRSEIIKAQLDIESGEAKFWQIKTVVDPEEVRVVEGGDEEETENNLEEDEQLPRYNSDRHIFIKEAKKIKEDAEVGEELIFPLETHEDFGRIAAQTAKQVILQGVREAERESIMDEFKDKEGEIVSGVIQRYERGHVYIDLDRSMGIMFQNESIPEEHYRSGQRMRFLVLAVQQEDRRKPGIVLSRSNPDFVAKLFELEVPEIAEGVVEIKKIAREAGSRTKIAVISHEEGIDPVGSVVGQRGSRIMAVINELGNEKIDVIEWSEEPEEYIENSLSPAKIKLVETNSRREAIVIVQDDHLSLAIGKGGQNVRLAAKLTGWKIDVRAQSNPDESLDEGTGNEEEVEDEGSIKDGQNVEVSAENKDEESKENNEESTEGEVSTDDNSVEESIEDEDSETTDEDDKVKINKKDEGENNKEEEKDVS